MFMQDVRRSALLQLVVILERERERRVGGKRERERVLLL